MYGRSIADFVKSGQDLESFSKSDREINQYVNQFEKQFTNGIIKYSNQKKNKDYLNYLQCIGSN